MTSAAGSYGGQFDLANYHEMTVLSLKWPFEGTALVYGKALLFNGDGDWQTVSVWLTHGHPKRHVMDYAEVWAHGGWRGYVPLTGWAYNLPAGEIIELRCATYQGNVDNTRLTAILVEDMRG